MRIPFQRPSPSRLSELTHSLKEIEDSGTFTNYGPVNSRLEADLAAKLFDGKGGCLTVNNATIGLIIAVKEATAPGKEQRFALMPSFTFAATAHAALWAGLTPLFCDVDEESWNMCPEREDDLLEKYGDRIACIMPYACFGNNLDLDRYDRLSRTYRCGIVVDAAASLGSKEYGGSAFGAGFRHALVYSMHATKTFATAEAGLIHSGDPERLARLRAMGNFGFGRPREATMPGLNSKLSEFGALLCLSKLETFEAIVARREAMAAAYVAALGPDFVLQKRRGGRLAYQFMPALLPEKRTRSREHILDAMGQEGIGCAHYFSPHLAEQAHFRDCPSGPLEVTARVAARVISLPMSDTITLEQVEEVCSTLGRVARD